MTRITRNIPADCCCDSWKKGIRTINGQYPDDNREFGIVEGAGILITPVTAGIKITNASNALVAGDNIKLTPNGDEMIISTTDDIRVNGDLNVDGDIIQQGASYETHMEQVYTADDYITMRDGAVSALSPGQYSGFQVKKYDGTNDGRLVIDNTGTARVGDVGDEQPLLTRSESGSLTNGQLFKWDSANSKAVGVNIDATPTNGSSNPVSSDGVYDAIPQPFGHGFKLPGGQIWQWGYKAVPANSSYVDISLYEAYPQNNYMVYVTVYDPSDSNLWSFIARVGGATKTSTGFRVYTQNVSGAAWSVDAGIMWMAVGY